MTVVISSLTLTCWRRSFGWNEYGAHSQYLSISGYLSPPFNNKLKTIVLRSSPLILSFSLLLLLLSVENESGRSSASTVCLTVLVLELITESVLHSHSPGSLHFEAFVLRLLKCPERSIQLQLLVPLHLSLS